MKRFDLPYGRGTISLSLPESRVKAVLESHLHTYRPDLGEEELVNAALESPEGSPRLSRLAKGKHNVVMIASDHTRPVPSRHIIPAMLREIREGNPEADITILIATGCHRAPTREELIQKFGEEIAGREKIVIHSCEDSEDFVSLGTLPSGGELILNRMAVEADLLCAEGFIEPHFFAGFSGGRKSVLPGGAARKTVLANHCSAFIDSPYARTGIIEGNPIHRDMIYAAKKAGLAFIVNVVINQKKEIIHAVAGDCDLAHKKGVSFLNDWCRTPAVPADIVVSTNGGYPLDQNFYQCVKGMTAAEACLNEDGVVIMCGECAAGHGGEDFYASLRDCASPAELYARQLATPWDETEPDQWESQILCRILSKHRAIFVTRPELRGMVEDMKMTYAPDIPSALALARSWGKESLTVIPDGVSVIPRA